MRMTDLVVMIPIYSGACMRDESALLVMLHWNVPTPSTMSTGLYISCLV